MRKLRLLFAMLVLLVTGVVAVNAETDVTSYLTNANLSADVTAADNGWTCVWRQDWKTASDADHVNVVEFYAGWGSLEHTEFAVSQEVTLPAGIYRLSVNAFYRNGNDGDGTNDNRAWIFAGETTQNVVGLGKSQLNIYDATDGDKDPSDLWRASNAFKLGDFINSFNFVLDSEQAINIGFQGNFDKARCWCILGPVRLFSITLDEFKEDYNAKKTEASSLTSQPMSSSAQSALSSALVDASTLADATAVQNAITALNAAATAAATSIAAYAEAKDFITQAKADRDAALLTLDAAGQAAYDGSALTALESSYNNGTLESVTDAQKTAITNALATAVKAQTSDGADMTLAIVNPGFETGDMTGWTIDGGGGDTGVKSNTTNPYTTTGGDGSYLYNTWNGDATGYGISQTIADMPAGSYKLTASLAGKVGATIDLFANNETTSFTQTNDGTFTDVEVEFELAQAGGITIGTTNSTSWYKVDNFRLILLQPAVVSDYTVTLNVTGTNDMGDSPTITVTGATQSGDVAYTAAANSTISITPEAVDGYSVEVTVTQTPATGGPEETVSASEVSGTWSFTLPDNNVNVSIAYTPIPTYAVTLIMTGTEDMQTMPTVSLTGGTIVENVFTATAGSTITVSAQAVEGYSVDVTVTETAPAGDPQTITPTLSNGKWSFTQPEYNTTVTVAYTQILQTITWAFSGLEESVEEPAVTFSGEGVVPVVENEVITSYQCPQGTTVTFSAPEIEGYENSYIYDSSNGLTITPNQGVYSFLVDVEDHNIQIIYTKVEYTITGLPATNTTLTIGDTQYQSGDVTATEGTIITVTPDLGYQITAITATYTPATGGDPIELTIDDAAGNGKSFTMPAANVTVTCTAEEIVIDPNAIPVTVPALSFVTYVDYNQDLSLATGDQAQLFGVSDVTDTEVLLTDQLTSVPSGHHFLIYNPTDADIIAQLMPSAPTAEMEGVGSNWYFFDMNGTTINPDDYTGFTLYICGGKQFLKAIGEGQLADHRWMLAVDNEPSDGGMKSRNIVFGETTNKITATNIKNATKGDFFDLSGRKVKAPKKGLYIVNGKKAVIK